MKTVFKPLGLLFVVVLLITMPLLLHKDSEFMGTDAQAEEAITAKHTDYQPWATSIWEPPSGEVESFLFALQAAVGSAIVFFYIGYQKGRHSRDR